MDLNDLAQHNLATPVEGEHSDELFDEEDNDVDTEPFVANVETVIGSSDDNAIVPMGRKHRLQNSWTYWLFDKDLTKSWEDQLNLILTVHTVEDFWVIAHQIQPPSLLSTGCDYLFFKKGIRPMWEDSANKNGGRWVITLYKSSLYDLDRLWIDSYLCLIGEVFDGSGETCGCVANIRNKFNKISIWTANGHNTDAVLKIGRRWKEELNWPHQIVYELHADNANKINNIAQPLHIL